MLASLAGTRFIPMTQLTCSRGSSGSCLHLCSQPSTSLPLHQCPVRVAVVHICRGGALGGWEPLALVGKVQKGIDRHTGYLFRNVCPLGSQADGAGSVLACV